jgi:hypothetical protein
VTRALALLGRYRAWVDDMSEDDRKWLFGATASEFYRL